MNANWKAGDRAVCVVPGGNPNFYGPRSTLGVVYLVATVFLSDQGIPIFKPAGIDLGNTLDGRPRGWRLYRFRKVVPACDRVSIHQEETA